MPSELAGALIDDFAPTGDVLELACGNGAFTRQLVRHARTVTAIDGSPRMLERNRREVDDSKVTYLHADIFEWRPDRRYDVVFFGFWLSHVPPTLLDEFWALVRSSLRPGGRVAFVDEDDRGTMNDDIHLLGDVPVAPERFGTGGSSTSSRCTGTQASLRPGSAHSTGRWRFVESARPSSTGPEPDRRAERPVESCDARTKRQLAK